VDHLDETEQRLLRLAVNRLGENGAWDLGELEARFKELVIADAPIEITGFGIDEVEQIIIGTDEGQREAVDLAAPGSSAIARTGDFFRLGAHRVIYGDATDPAVIQRLMGCDVARLVLTDEPLETAILENATEGATSKTAIASERERTPVFLISIASGWTPSCHICGTAASSAHSSTGAACLLLTVLPRPCA
jgi:hypothetical protein